MPPLNVFYLMGELVVEDRLDKLIGRLPVLFRHIIGLTPSPSHMAVMSKQWPE